MLQEFPKAAKFNAIPAAAYCLATSCCNGDKSRTSFRTPMPQIPQSVFEEMQRSKQWMLRRKPTASLQEQIAGAAAAASGPSGKTNGTGTQLLLGLFLKQISAVGQTGVPNARRKPNSFDSYTSVRMTEGCNTPNAILQKQLSGLLLLIQQ